MRRGPPGSDGFRRVPTTYRTDWPNFAVLTSLLTLSVAILVAETASGWRIGAQTAPTWAARPLKPPIPLQRGAKIKKRSLLLKCRPKVGPGTLESRSNDQKMTSRAPTWCPKGAQCPPPGPPGPPQTGQKSINAVPKAIKCPLGPPTWPQGAPGRPKCSKKVQQISPESTPNDKSATPEWFSIGSVCSASWRVHLI